MPECEIVGERCGFECTGYDGSHVWEKWEQDAKEIECEKCSDHAQKWVSFSHDHFNLGLGKQAFDPSNYHQVFQEAECVRNKCIAEGRC